MTRSDVDVSEVIYYVQHLTVEVAALFGLCTYLWCIFMCSDYATIIPNDFLF